MPAAALTLYTTTWCGYCRILKRSLARAGLDFVEINLETDPSAARFVEAVNGGNQTVPTVLLADGTTLTNPSVREIQAALAGT